MSDLSSWNLLYDARPGETVDQAARRVIEHGLGGMLFNGKVIRRMPSDDAHMLICLYQGRARGPKA